ncbi:MAG: GFA family protein [Sneathiella sp.]
MTTKENVQTGGCLCGAVQFEVSGPFRDIIMCHCSMCQQASGHHAAATAAPSSAFLFKKQTGLTWYRSSSHAERGFCRKCGSSLLWKMEGRDDISIFVGCLAGPVNLPVSMHVFTGEKKDYYQISDHAEQFERYPDAPGFKST